jgi:hypothetical protein
MKAINVKRLCVVAAPFLLAASAQADVVTDWNQRASEITVAHQAGPWGQAPMVLIQAAVFESVNAVTRRYPQAGYLKLDAPAGASIDAAVAAAIAPVLIRMATTQGAGIEAAYQGRACHSARRPCESRRHSAGREGRQRHLGDAKADRGASRLLPADHGCRGVVCRRSFRPMPISRQQAAGCSIVSISSARAPRRS